MDFKIIEEIIDKKIDEIIRFRRDIHQFPELSKNEKRTSQKIIEKLKKLKIEVVSGINGHGIIATLQGGQNKKTILLRGDMDALPLQEINELPFISKNKNVMHACGHDMHTSIILGTAMVLNEIKKDLKGNIKFMFQPAEEDSPIGGAQGMIEEGILENPKVHEAYGLHLFGIPTGKIMIKPGVATSRSDKIVIEIFGKSSHASMPSEGVDAIVTAANIVMGIQSIVSRNIPNDMAVITIGKIEGGDRYNILADYVRLEGTVRTFSDKVVEVLKERLEKIVRDISSAYNCVGKLHYEDGYGYIYNDLELSNAVIQSIGKTIGEKNVLVEDKPLPAGEDFSFISKKVPSVFIWLGTQTDFNKDKCTLHSPHFMADEDSLKVGIKILCGLVLDRLE